MPDDSSCDSLRELLSVLASGNAEALKQIHESCGGVLFSICMKVLKNPVEAEDAYQDVLVQIWQRAAKYDPALGKPMTWLMTVTRNRCYDRYRSMTRRVPTQAETLTEIEQSSLVKGGDDALLDKERSQKILTVMSSLKDEQRESIEMTFFMGHTQEEAAAKLNVPLGTLKARIRRGLQVIRRMMINDTDLYFS